MCNSSYVPHYAISRYSIREFNKDAEPFMVAMIIIIIIIELGKNQTVQVIHYIVIIVVRPG